MKILMLMPTHISEGGIETVAIYMWKELLKLNHEVFFVCHGKKNGTYESMIKERGTRIYHIPGKSEDLFGTIKNYKEILKKEKPDVVHAHMNATSGIYLQIAKKYGVKVLVAHSHVSTMKMYTSSKVHALINNIEKIRTNKYANVKIACSDKAGKWLFGNSAYNVILNAVDVSKFSYNEDIRNSKRKELGISEDVKVIIHVGGFLEYKNHLFLLDVFSKIREVETNSMLLLVGDGPLRAKITDKINELGINKCTMLLGARNDVFELMQVADMFMLPSLSEGNPVALVEAATSGMKCLVSDTVARDIVKYFEDGAIKFLPIEDKMSIKKWVDESRKEWKRIIYSKSNPCRISSKIMTKEIEDLYKSVI